MKNHSVSFHHAPGLACLAMTLSLLALIGCTPKNDAAGGGGGAAPVAAGESGEAVYNTSCARCHGGKGKGGGKAPDLSHVGADPSHTAEWLAAYIKDPKSKDPSSHMPAFGGRLSDAQIQAVASYLAAMK